MSILAKRILKTLVKIYHGFCFMMGCPYELAVLMKRSPACGPTKFLRQGLGLAWVYILWAGSGLKQTLQAWVPHKYIL